MAVAEVSVVPVGTGSASISKYVAAVVDIVEKSGLRFELNSMGTVIEGDIESILGVVRRMHESTFSEDVVRVLTSVKIDDRRDKALTMGGKLASVKKARGR